MKPKPKKLLDRVRETIRLKQYSNKTEQAYLNWIKHYILFHDKKRPQDMGAFEVETFLTNLAVDRLAGGFRAAGPPLETGQGLGRGLRRVDGGAGGQVQTGHEQTSENHMVAAAGARLLSLWLIFPQSPQEAPETMSKS